MGENSQIAWTDHTFNPWEGCCRVSAECTNCYAETRDERFHGGVHWGKKADRKAMSAAYWKQPRKWNRSAAEAGERRRVFCASLADVFEDRRDLDPIRADLWDLIRQTPHLDWLLLTKRPENIEELTAGLVEAHCCRDTPDMTAEVPWCADCDAETTPVLPRNVWLGTTVGHDDSMSRIGHLMDASEYLDPAVTFLSCEPLLGPLDMGNGGLGWLDLIDWVICGGESGPNARPVDPAWVRDLRDQCQTAGVPFFFKQWGGTTPDAGGHLLDGQEIREFPASVG